MTVARVDDTIVLSEVCDVAEAERLLALLAEHPRLPVDISKARAIHTALWQVLMACRSRIIGAPADSFATKWLVPSIAAGD